MLDYVHICSGESIADYIKKYFKKRQKKIAQRVWSNDGHHDKNPADSITVNGVPSGAVGVRHFADPAPPLFSVICSYDKIET